MKNTANQRQYLGETVDACNRAVDVFREGEHIVIKYKESQHESQQLISYLQAQLLKIYCGHPMRRLRARLIR